MDILDRLLDHDYFTTRELLVLCAPLEDAQLDQSFDIGFGSLRATFTHMIGTMEFWCDQIAERDEPRPYTGRPGETLSVEDLLGRLDTAAADLRVVARAIHDNDLDDSIMEVVDEGTTFRFTRGSAVLHVITHSMHHRAQILNMLRHLGVEHEVEGDPISWEFAVGVVDQE